MNSPFNGNGIEINLVDQAQNFLKVKETLTRIGVTDENEGVLFQSCHILHKRDSANQSCYAIMHFKEMFVMDGKKSTISMVDILRRNAITKLLIDWNLVTIHPRQEPVDMIIPKEVKDTIKIITHKDKHMWALATKYTIGTNGKRN